MTGPKRHDYLPRYDSPRGLPYPGCHCGWTRPVTASSMGNARREYEIHLEQVVNDFEAKVHEAVSDFEAKLHEANRIMDDAGILGPA